MKTSRPAFTPALIVGWLLVALLGSPGEASSSLENGFRQPPEAARPWVYWWWLKGNVSESSITHDLEAMKQMGVGGLLLFDARGYHEDHVPPPPSRMDFMSPQWRKMLKHAMAEAHRLGLVMSVNLSSCAGALKGPWEVGDDAPKRLVWTSAGFQGPRRITSTLRPGGGRLWEVGVFACRHIEAQETPLTTTETAEPNLAGQWLEAVLSAQPNGRAVDVLDLSDKVDPQGRLAWDAPPGRWTLVRFAFGVMAGRENEVDILSRKAVDAHFQRMGRAILDDAGPLAGKTLTHFYSVSWEGASPTWTSGFEQEFRKRRDYDPRPFLPVLAGMTIRAPEVSRRFLEDYRRTLSDCFRDNCYGTLLEQCHRAGIKWHSESGGPWDRNGALFAEADQPAFWAVNDMPQGEFWCSGARQTNSRRAAMAAHVYGLPLAAVEAFTHMKAHWSMYPAVLKPEADAALCDGINHFIWHTFTASGPEFGKPGIEYFAGTHLNPNVTWWEYAGDFIAYLARCQTMLRVGQFVADVGCYTSDRTYSRWSRGEKWSDKPSLVLPRGYSYDVFNTDVLAKRLSVKDGRLTLPHGMWYRLLAVDLEDDAVPPEALHKILKVAESGAAVVLGKRRPARAPGLTGYPSGDAEVRRLAGDLWGPADGPAGCRARGRGRIYVGTGIDQVLAAERIAPDVVGPCDYIHREIPGADIYFVAGKGRTEYTFRTAGQQPELWDPVTGRTREAICYRQTGDGRTTIPIALPDNGSVFVVLRKPSQEPPIVSVSGPDGGLDMDGRSGQTLHLHLWRAGHYVLNDAQNRTGTIDLTSLPEPLSLAGPWEVRFALGRGAPEKALFQHLVPWNEHPDKGIRYFSGTATYRTSFEADETAARALARLDLGKVHNIARVRLNGRDLGVVWTAPWTRELSDLIRPGINELEIEVTNLWVNRLIGDAALPENERLTRTNVGLFAKRTGRPAWQGFSAEDPLQPSGLVGPVRIEFGRRQELRLEQGLEGRTGNPGKAQLQP
jgi:hypothetical protein